MKSLRDECPQTCPDGNRIRKYAKPREMITMVNRNVDIEERHVEKKSDSSLVAATFIKYAAYIIIFFGALYFLVKYVFPKFWFSRLAQ